MKILDINVRGNPPKYPGKNIRVKKGTFVDIPPMRYYLKDHQDVAAWVATHDRIRATSKPTRRPKWVAVLCTVRRRPGLNPQLLPSRSTSDPWGSLARQLPFQSRATR